VIKLEILMENRAWRGVRLVSDPIKERNREYVYIIGWHVGVGMFYLDEEVTYLDRMPRETYGGIIAFARVVKPLIRYIEQNRNVNIKLKEDIAAQEEYEIAEGRRILEKYPKWRSSPNKPVLG
jgi:hypothetical protein